MQQWRRQFRIPESAALLDNADGDGHDDDVSDAAAPWYLLHPDPNDFSDRVMVPVVLGQGSFMQFSVDASARCQVCKVSALPLPLTL